MSKLKLDKYKHDKDLVVSRGQIARTRVGNIKPRTYSSKPYTPAKIVGSREVDSE